MLAARSIETVTVPARTSSTSSPIAALLKQAGLTGSTSDGMRMIAQGAGKIDGEKVSSKDVKMSAGSEHVYQFGKHKYARIRVL